MFGVYPFGMGMGPMLGPLGGLGRNRANLDTDEFNGSQVVSATAKAGAWLLTGSSAVAAYQSADKGTLRLTTGGAGTAHAQIQRPIGSFQPATGRKMRFATKLRLDDVSLCLMFVGLNDMIADVIGDVANIDGIGFEIDEADGFLKFSAGAGSGVGESVSTGLKLADVTDADLEFELRGLREAVAYVNGVKVATIKSTSNIVAAASLLSPTFAVQETTAAARYLEAGFEFTVSN